jgi:tetratricopeptide (TPR) repeat protein
MTKKGSNMTDTHTWRSLENMAIWQRHRGHHDAAIANLEKAIALIRDDRALSLEAASLLNYLADLFLKLGRLKEAETTIRDALLRTANESMYHADNLMILGKVLLDQGRDKEAAEMQREGLRLIRREYGPNHPYTIATEATLETKHITLSKSA